MKVDEVVHGSTALWIASKNGHPDVVRVLLNHSDTDVNWNTDGRTPLYVASSGGHVEVVKLLLDHPRVEVNVGTFGEVSRERHVWDDTLETWVWCGRPNPPTETRIFNETGTELNTKYILAWILA